MKCVYIIEDIYRYQMYIITKYVLTRACACMNIFLYVASFIINRELIINGRKYCMQLIRSDV